MSTENLDQYIFIDPPKDITHETLGLGNIVKLKWETVPTASLYAIEKYDVTEEAFVLIDVTRSNFYLDYSNIAFSSDEATTTVRYRIASVGGEYEIYESTSDVYFFTVPKLDPLYLNLIEKEDSNSIIAEIVGYKEEKLIIENGTELDLHKLSTLSPNTDSNITDLKLDLSAYGGIKASYTVNDDFGFYLQFSNNSIVKFNQNTLFPVYTLPTLNRSIKEVQIGQRDNIICCLESVFDEDQITIFEVENDIVKTNITPIKIESDTGNALNIVDYSVVGDKNVFILDETCAFHLYEIDFVAREVNKVVTYDSLLKEKYTHGFVSRKVNLIKSAIVEVLKLQSSFTDEEKYLIEEITYTESSDMQSIIDDYIDLYIIAIGNDHSDPVFKDLIDTFLDEILDLIFANEILKDIDVTALSTFRDTIKNSEDYEIYYKTMNRNGARFLHLDDNIVDNLHMIHSTLSNHMIIWCPYFVYFIDITALKFHNAIDCLLPKQKVLNYSIDDFYPESSVGTNPMFDALRRSEVDKVIKDVTVNDNFDNVSIHFEEISAMPLYQSNEIVMNYEFSTQYIDVYKLDPNDVFSQDINTGSNSTFDYTHYKGFAYPLVYNYPNPNNPLLANSYYFYNGKCYHSQLIVQGYERLEATISDQLIYDLSNGYIVEVTESLYDVLHFNTRINLTSNRADYNSTRYFSMFGDENSYGVVDGGTLTDSSYSFLDGQTLYTSNVYKGMVIKSEFDRYGTMFIVTSSEDEPDTDGMNTTACIHIGEELFAYHDVILLPKIIFTRHKYVGHFFEKSISCDDRGMFLRGFQNDIGENFVLYCSPLVETFSYLSVDNIRKIELDYPEQFYDTISAVFIERSELDFQLPPALILYNDQKINEENGIDFYGQKEECVWRWEIDYSVLLESDYLAFRVSLDNKEWEYLPKNARSISTTMETGDGTHLFHIQYQYRNGTWSESLSANYHLKTSRPNKPVLLSLQTDSTDRGKPILTWDRSPDHYKYEITYNDSIYYSVFDSFHSPDESFTNYTSNIVNVPISIRSVDLHGNYSEYSNWSFVVSSYTKKDLNIVFDKYTNNPNPLFSWSPDSGEFLNRYIYSFDNGNEVTTTDLSCTPANNLEEGIHSFKIIGIDSLGNTTREMVKYFEIKSSIGQTPELLQESIDRTLNCKQTDLWFNFVYKDATDSFLYSFDNFKTFYSFSNYTLDLRDLDLPQGFNTIYLKSIDRFGNESEILEYTFKIVGQEKVYVNFDNVDTITSNQSPTWSWKTTSEYKYSHGELYRDEELIEEFSNRIVNTYKPSSKLIDGKYTLSIQTKNDLGDISYKNDYTIVIDSSIPTSPSLSRKSISKTTALFSFNVPSDVTIFGSLVEMDNDVQQKFYHESLNGDFIFTDLKENTNYIFEVYHMSNNSKKSQSFFYGFTTTSSIEGTIKQIVLANGVVVNYNMSNGSYTIPKYGDYTNDKIIINNEEYEISEVIVDSNVDDFSYTVLENRIIKLQTLSQI